MQAPNVIRPVSQWRDPRHRRGLAGELAAARHLEAEGWLIEDHRFRFGRHDVDLVARRANLVAFIEVKTRGSGEFGSGAESIGYRKRAILELVAEVWRVRRGRAVDEYRFDVVLVGWQASRPDFPQVVHIADAWRCSQK